MPLIGVACGGSSAQVVHTVPGYEVEVALPSSWDAAHYQSSEEEIEEFQRSHPRFLGVVDILRSADARRFVAAEQGGDVRLLLSISETAPGQTLRRHIQKNLLALEDARVPNVRIDGPRREVVALGGARAWRLRWSYDGDLGRVQLVQYTFVRDGYAYLFTYSTLKRWEEASDVFAASASSIRIGVPSRAEPVHAEGLIAFHRERDNESSDIYAMSAAGTGQRRLTRTGTDAFPTWSPDGDLIAFTSARDGNPEIYVMQADGGDQRRLTSDPATDQAPSWSPDGRRIMFTRGSCDDACDLYVMNADGTGLERVTHDGASIEGSWSPDGERIVFWGDRDLDSGIFVMNADATDARLLTPDFDAAWGADWSPDGSAILFVGSKDDPATGDEVVAIYRMNADGSGTEKVADATGWWIDEPEWSPDGSSIAFFSDGQGPGAIWVMNADGTQQRPLTHHGDSHSPSWQAARHE